MAKLESSLQAEHVELESAEDCYRGFLTLRRLRLRFRLFRGGWSDVVSREVQCKAPAVGVLLYDAEADKVVMVRQFRAGVFAAGQAPWVLELVAGMIDTDETPEQVAHRECEEETGCEAGELMKIAEYFNSPGASDERMILFCGAVDASRAGGYHGLVEDNEDIEVVVLSYDEACAALNEGRFNNAMSIIALQWLQLKRDYLREKWRKTPPLE